MHYVKQNFLAGLQLCSLEAINAAARRWTFRCRRSVKPASTARYDNGYIAKVKTIHISELMRLVEAAAPAILDYSVGFVKAVTMSNSGPEPEFDAVLGGSGVLVTANGRYAILTADHVIQNLPKNGPVGLIMLGRGGGIDHQFILEMDFVQTVTVGRGENESLGPDLAVIILPRKDIGRLEVWKTFYNLSKRKTEMLSNLPPSEGGPWLLSGLIAEMTEELPPRRGMTKHYSFKGLCGPVIVPGARSDENFDYFTVEVNCGKPYDLPESFGGCSGCGLWRLVLRENAGGWTLDDILLGGIAFYQSALLEGRRNIECHACKSIYSNVEELLAGRG